MEYEMEKPAGQGSDAGKRHPAPGVSSPPDARPDPDAETPPSPEKEPQDLPEPLTLPEHEGGSEKDRA